MLPPTSPGLTKSHLDESDAGVGRQVGAEVLDVEDSGELRLHPVDDDARRERLRRLGVVGAASVRTQRPLAKAANINMGHLTIWDISLTILGTLHRHNGYKCFAQLNINQIFYSFCAYYA